MCTCLHVHSFQIDVCQMELTQSKLTWKRASQLIKVISQLINVSGTDDLEATKLKCTEALNISSSPKKLVLIVKGAIIDESAFSSLGSFMDALTAQQRSHLVLGLGIQVQCKCMCMYNMMALDMMAMLHSDTVLGLLNQNAYMFFCI